MANVNMEFNTDSGTLNLDDLKPNSHQYNRDMERAEEANEEKSVEKVVTGKVTQKKKSLGRKFVEIFFADGEDIGDIKRYLVEDVLVPAVKENIADAINGAIGMLFFGEVRRRASKSGNGSGTKVNYGGYFNGGDSRRERMAKSTREKNSRTELDDFLFESRADAEQVRDEMLEMLDTYNQVTVADYLDMLGKTSEFTDNKYGWTDLGNIRVVAGRGGYRLILPREMPL